ncbi:MAG: short-chain dehydrogenase/reductase [Moraxellaceae bacterium]|jgi:pteridine reductase|nr:short-chain dehydrogenase/reductase [Moraxellaceae bacterium]
MADTESRVVLITGAAQRLGAATARLLHAHGWRILLHYNQSREKADEIAAEMNAQRPDSCRLLQADLAGSGDVERLARAAEASWQRVDALVNNASAFYPTPVGEITAAQWDELFASNARAPLFLAQALQPALQRRHGAIVNLLDIHARQPLRGYTVYCMAKAAHQMLTLALAKELAPHVRVNGVAPGAILWPSQGSPDAEAKEAILAGIPLGRLGEPADIARTIAFLLEDAPYITGQIIAVDGGRSL